jgi:hypothetical protein
MNMGNKLAQGMKLLMCIMEVPGSNIGRNAGYSDLSYFWIFVYVEADPGIVP